MRARSLLQHLSYDALKKKCLYALQIIYLLGVTSLLNSLDLLFTSSFIEIGRCDCSECLGCGTQNKIFFWGCVKDLVG